VPDEPNSTAPRIVLIGMRGAGKSTLGRALAERLSRPFVDIDELIGELAGRPADDVLARDGEPAFRALEERALRLAAGRAGAVVALWDSIRMSLQRPARGWNFMRDCSSPSSTCRHSVLMPSRFVMCWSI